ncbi:hypothetical protein RFI_15112 [Reticulomyxa filosa]|uniref:Phosphatidic acid phosphatase type 2/haloperoxidase domain-containing protein n=1 Tax=Reticulomyxa filosa TaxID=46433 RepID=X6N7R6_RETFI|nr:hypothetical protein RFI_15112 [Reticulomyxa filosa]|eukprot:ETO22091.1 hypothetical protein RFI_15112 [Reticulomyxa filosa]
MFHEKTEPMKPHPLNRFHTFKRNFRHYCLEWVVIGLLGIISLLINVLMSPFHQCVSFVDPNCGGAENEMLTFPEQASTVSSLANVLIALSIWIAVCALSVLFLIQLLHPKPVLWNMLFFKVELILRVLLFAVLLCQVKKKKKITKSILVHFLFKKKGFTKKNARLSFPSGHTTFAFVSMFLLFLFLFRCILFVQHQAVGMEDDEFEHFTKEWYCWDNLYCFFLLPLWIKLRHNIVLSAVLSLLPVAYACFVGVTRITDYWHHYEDVTAGAIVGMSCAYFSYFIHRIECFPKDYFLRSRYKAASSSQEIEVAFNNTNEQPLKQNTDDAR